MDDEKEVTTTRRTIRPAFRKRKKKATSQAVSVKRNRLFLSRAPRAPIPYKLKTSMLYQERAQLTPLAGLASVVVYSANGTFDPTIALGGHQPRGFDQLMSLYDHNVVIGCDIRVDFPPVTAGGSINASMCWVALRDFTTVGITEQDYLELGDCTWEINSPQGGHPTRLMMSCDPNKFLGRKSPLSDPDLKNSTVSNPTEQAYWHIGMQSASGLDATTINVNIVIKYTCVFIEPKDPGSS